MSERGTDHTSSAGAARAGAVIVGAGEVLGSSQVRWDERGLITSVEPCASMGAVESETVLAPGFVNAHAHLDLGGLAALGKDPGQGQGFVGWIGRVMAARAAWGDEGRRQGLAASVERALRAGTTAVIDVDSTGWATSDLPAATPRIVRCRELLDASPASPDERTEAALRDLAALVAPGPSPRALVVDGISPHGTHTVGDELFRAVGERMGPAREGGLLSTVHWAETLEEVRWLTRGEGPFASWLGASPLCSGVERMARAGALSGAILAHGNHPVDGELELLREHDAAVVHCPGSHLYFGREPFPIDRYRSAGVPVLLGTDSLGSNEALDMGREARLAMGSLGLSADEAWRAITEEPASRLPWPEVTGRIEVGAAADLVRHRFAGAGPRGSIAALLGGGTNVIEVFVAGRVALSDQG